MILVVAATAREAELADGAETLVCGVGPVEAALVTARRLASSRPSAIVHIGIAGARALAPPALVLGSEAVYCDIVDPRTVLSRVARAVPDATLLERARAALPEAHVLPIGTTGRVGGGLGCEVEAMEGFGVLRAAVLAGVPAVELRAVSNPVAEQDRGRWRVDDALAALRTGIRTLLGALDA